MYFFITLIITILVGIVSFKLFAASTSEDKDVFLVSLVKPVLITIATFIILLIQPYTVHRVDAGNVGIEVQMTGDSRGVGKYEYKTGYVVYNTWFTRLYEFPTFQQHVDYPEQLVITKGGLQTQVEPSFNYSLKPGDVGDMFSNLRLPIDQVEQKWLQTAIVGTVNDVANRWTVDSIFNHRQEFEGNIVADVNKKIARWFVVSQLRTNIKPPPSLGASILAKTKAIQDVQIAENQKKVKVAEGLTRIAETRADSSIKVINALADARVMKERQLTLTPLYIEYSRVNKWDGHLPTYSAGNSGMGLMINPTH